MLFCLHRSLPNHDMTAQELRSHDVQNLNIRAAAITSDSKWMVCVGKYHGNDDKSKKLGRMHHILGMDILHGTKSRSHRVGSVQLGDKSHREVSRYQPKR